MSKFSERRKLRKKMPVTLGTIPGRLGDGYGNVNVPGQVNYVYCRVGNGIEIVYNDRVPAQHNLSVDLGRENTGSEVIGRYRVLGMRSNNPAGSGGTTTGTGYAPSKRYRWMAMGGGQDPLWVEQRQLMPLRIGPFSGLTIQLQPGLVWNGTNLIAVRYQIIDVSAYQPTVSGKAVYVAISIDAVGGLVETVGNEFILEDMTTAELMLANVPELPNDIVYFCGAVRLRAGQDEILEGRSNSDIVDPRSSGFIPSAFIGGGGLTAVAHDDSLAGDGTSGDPLGIAFGTYIPADPGLDLFEDAPTSTQITTYNLLKNALNIIQTGANVAKLNLFGFGGGSIIRGFRANGTKASPSAILDGQTILGISGRAHDGTDYQVAAQIVLKATEDFSSTAWGSKMEFSHSPTGEATSVVGLTIDENGLDIPTGRTFNINGVPHTHPGGGLPVGGSTTQLLQWDSDGVAKWITVSGDATIADGGAVSVNKTRLFIRNETGSSIATTKAVYVSGFNNYPLVSLADNTNEAKHNVLGITVGSIAHEANGYIATSGQCDAETNSWNVGDELYLSTSGALTTSEPTSGSVQHVGIVTVKENYPVGKILLYLLPEGNTVAAGSGQDVIVRMGDSAGSNKVSFKDYANSEVASIDSNGNILFDGTVDHIISVSEQTASDHAKDLTLKAGDAPSGISDKYGGDLVLSSGASNGSFNSRIFLRAPIPGVSGTTTHTPATIETIQASSSDSILHTIGVAVGSPVETSQVDLVLYGNSTVQVRTKDISAPSDGNSLSIIAGSMIDVIGASDQVGGELILKAGRSSGIGASEISFWTSTPGTAGGHSQIAQTEKMTLDGSGNLSVVGAVTGSNLSGTNTGDETVTTIKSKLGISTLSGSNTGDQSSVSGNAGSATVLQTPRTIAGVSFDGSANITIPSTGLSDVEGVTAFTPEIRGTTTAGTATYSTRVGYYYRIGKMVFVELKLEWTGHTGTGNMRIYTMPYAFKDVAISPPFAVVWSNLTLASTANKVIAIGISNESSVAVQTITSGAVAALTMDAAAMISIAGFYLID